MKTALILALTSAAAVAGAVSNAPWTAPAAPAAQRELEVSGAVGQWRVEEDGTVLVRIDRHPSADSDEPWVWFRLAPDRSANIRIERMLLDVLLAMEALPDPQTLTLSGKVERSLDGTTADQALPLLGIEHAPAR